MKNKLMLFLLFALFLFPSSLAFEEPTQLGLINLSFYGGVAGCQNHPSFYSGTVVSWSSYTAYVCRTGDFNYQLEVINSLDVNNNYLIFSEDVSSGFTINDLSLTYEDGYLFVGANFAGSGAIWVYDVSDIQFVTQEVSGVCPINLGKLYVLKSDSPYRFATNGASNVLKVNSSNVCINEDSLGVTINNALFDKENLVFTTNNLMYAYNENWGSINTTLLHTMPISKGSYWVDWINNPNNPLYLTNTGFVTLTGGRLYNDIKHTNLPIVTGTPVVYQDVDNIISFNNSEMILTDFSDFIISSILKPNIFTGGDEFRRTSLNNFISENMSAVSYFNNNMIVEVYNFSSPDITIFAEGENPPTVEAEFIGVDSTGSFVFLTEMVDEEGGRAYLSQSLYESSIDINNIIINEIIDFSKESDELKIFNDNALLSIDNLVTTQLSYFNNTPYYQQYYSNVPLTDTLITYSFNNPALRSEANSVSVSASLTSLGVLGTENTDFSFSIVDDLNNKIIDLKIIYDFNIIGNDTFEIRNNDGDVLLNSGNPYENTDDLDQFIITANVDFNSNNSFITVSGRNGLYYNGTLPFIDSSNRGVYKIQSLLMGNFFGSTAYYTDFVGYSQSTTEQASLNYELFENLEAGISIVKATRQDGVFEFGDYNLYSYATDEDFGFSYLDSFDIEGFTYSETTSVLTEDEINALLAQREEEVEGIIQGDILTDTIDQALESAGFKSATSKLFLAVVLIIIFVSIGHAYGTVGSIMGAVGAIFISFFLGWLPAWIVITMVLGLIAIASLLARNLVVGGR